MDIGLIFSIAAGIIIGGVVLIYRQWFLDRGVNGVRLSVDGVKATGRSVYVARRWVMGCLVLAVAATFFAFTRVERTPMQWAENQRVKNEMRVLCDKYNMHYWSADRDSFYCAKGFDETQESLFYMREQCILSRYVAGQKIDSQLNEDCVQAGRRN